VEDAGVLLLDLDAGGSLGGRLRDILLSSPKSDIRFKYKAYSDVSQSNFENELPAIVGTYNPSLILLALSSMPMCNQEKSIRTVRRAIPASTVISNEQVPIVAAIDTTSHDQLFDLSKLGVADFVIPPLKDFEVLARIKLRLKRIPQERAVKQSPDEMYGLQQLIGKSQIFLTEINKITALTNSNVSVLITGETGTGKEMVARSIHYLSRRANKPFVPLNCGAIPVDLVENELFGHERGAFTGASNTQTGLIHEADKGTLFLDEADSLPLLAQVKLLRFLQHKEYRPLGSTKVLAGDVRIIAASNANLEEAVAAGKIRQDFYYRLNVVPVSLPPLRERADDIPLLAAHFLAKYAAEFDSPAEKFSPKAIQKLMLYNWPGNVRELEHLIERAVVLCDQTVIEDSHITLTTSSGKQQQESFQEAKARLITQFEENYIRGLLTAYNGNISKAADAAQKERRTFWGLMRKHKITVQQSHHTPLRSPGQSQGLTRVKLPYS